MKVAVIGAGSSGCCAAKNSLENGLEPTIFEKAKFPGGLWASCNDNRTAVWDGLYANISYFCMQFSDHPHTYGPSIIPSFKDISAYIIFVLHFNSFFFSSAFCLKPRLQTSKDI